MKGHITIIIILSCLLKVMSATKQDEIKDLANIDTLLASGYVKPPQSFGLIKLG